MKITCLKRGGFTMIELIVAMGLFLILIAAATGAFVQALRTQRSIVALMSANDNMSQTLERMAREIRVGYNFTTNASLDELTFVNAYNEQVTYRLNSQAIERGVSTFGGGTNFTVITADNVRVDRMQFLLVGAQSGDGMPPRITIDLTVGARGKNLENIQINIQTTISARLIDT